MMYKQIDIFELETSNERSKLTTIEHNILNELKYRDISTEELMKTYNLERVEVRKAIKQIRRHKTGFTMIMNCQVVYDNKKCHGYSTNGNDLLFTRWKSSTETMLKNNPFVLEQCYQILNEIKKKFERPAEFQTKAQFTNYKPHDVIYKSYEKKENKK